MVITHGSLALEWLGYATVRLECDGTVVYLDPGRYGVLTGEWSGDDALEHPPARDYRAEDADLVCVTHVHHYDPDGIDRVASDDATILALEGINVQNSPRELPRPVELSYDVREVGVETEGLAAGTVFFTVPAYNELDGERVRPDGTPHHPPGRGCGFVLEIGDLRVFWPGDTDVLEGHSELDVDVFCPPIGGSFTMDRTEAAQLGAALDPELVVPIHYDTFAAIEADAQAFAAEVASAGVPVALDRC